MAMGHFVRLGDKTTCGGTVLEGEHGFIVDGLPRSFEGARVSCGEDGETYAIVGGISHMTCNGRRVAGTLDSISSCPCEAGLIASCVRSTYQSSRVATGAAASRGLNALRPQSSGFAVEQSINPISTPLLPVPIGSMGFKRCDDPDRMEVLASYIAGEMNTNLRHPAVLEMRELMSFDPYAETEKYNALPFYLRLGKKPDLYALALAKRTRALAIWVERVGQDRPWDHKPIIRRNLKSVWHKQGVYDYYYDIWSNIHYGYIGTAAGLSESALLDGAGGEQIVSDIVRKVDEVRKKDKVDWKLLGPHPSAEPWTQLRSWDDVADRIAIGLGITFYQEFPLGGIAAKNIMDAVLAITPLAWANGTRIHVCE